MLAFLVWDDHFTWFISILFRDLASYFKTNFWPFVMVLTHLLGLPGVVTIGRPLLSKWLLWVVFCDPRDTRIFLVLATRFLTFSILFEVATSNYISYAVVNFLKLPWWCPSPWHSMIGSWCSRAHPTTCLLLEWHSWSTFWMWQFLIMSVVNLVISNGSKGDIGWQ